MFNAGKRGKLQGKWHTREKKETKDRREIYKWRGNDRGK